MGADHPRVEIRWVHRPSCGIRVAVRGQSACRSRQNAVTLGGSSVLGERAEPRASEPAFRDENLFP
jgi:hypothetical protein